MSANIEIPRFQGQDCKYGAGGVEMDLIEGARTIQTMMVPSIRKSRKNVFV